MKEMELGVGMLGDAFMGKAHTNAYVKMPLFFFPPPARPKLVGICGRNKTGVEKAARRYGYLRAYTDWHKLIADDDVDLVDNGFPNFLHQGPSIEAVEKGKHILCEKPLAMNATEASEMLRAARKAGVKHMVANNYRFVPSIRLAKLLIEHGRIGRVVEFRFAYLQDWLVDPNFPLTWRMRKRTAGTGVIGDLGSHLFDLARMLVGEVEAVTALTKTFVRQRPLERNPGKMGRVDVDDMFVSLLEFKGGAVGTAEASRYCAGMKNRARIEIHGTEGTISVDFERLNELELYTTSDDRRERGFKTILVTEKVHPFGDIWWPPGHVLGWEHAMVHEIHHLFDAIANDKPIEPLGATFYDGYRVSKILDAIAKSSQTGRWETTL